ncbi:MAG: carboxymuconolactone decarboxylase family protein [Pseudaminobacter sp.]
MGCSFSAPDLEGVATDGHARYRKLLRSELDAEQLRIFDDIARPRGGQVPAPFHVYLESPELCQLVQALGAFCRYRTGLPPRLSEIAILVTATHWRAEYEFEVHAGEALKAGVSAGEIDALRSGVQPAFSDAEADLIYRFSSAFYQHRDVPDALFEETISVFGRRTIVELVGVLGYYSMLAIALRIFHVPAVGSD